MISKMKDRDLNEVLAIAGTSRWTSWSQESFSGELKNPSSYCFVLVAEETATNRIIGFICFRIVDDESELLNIGIHPEFRQRGCGRRLLEFYIDFCRCQNVHSLYLETAVSNEAAIHLYRSFGYDSAGLRSRFYRQEEDALLMMKRA